MAQGGTVTRRGRRQRLVLAVEVDIPEGASDEDVDDVISALSGYINNDDRGSDDPRVRNEQSLIDGRVDRDRDAYKAGREYAKRSDEHAYQLTPEQKEVARRIIHMGVELLYDTLIPKLLELIGQTSVPGQIVAIIFGYVAANYREAVMDYTTGVVFEVFEKLATCLIRYYHESGLSKKIREKGGWGKLIAAGLLIAGGVAITAGAVYLISKVAGGNKTDK